MVAVGIISRELGDKLSKAKMSQQAENAEQELERENKVESDARRVGTRRYELMRDESAIDGFMSRLVVEQHDSKLEYPSSIEYFSNAIVSANISVHSRTESSYKMTIE